jgi:hypothetical protein
VDDAKERLAGLIGQKHKYPALKKYEKPRQKVDRRASESPAYKPATHLLYYN